MSKLNTIIIRKNNITTTILTFTIISQIHIRTNTNQQRKINQITSNQTMINQNRLPIQPTRIPPRTRLQLRRKTISHIRPKTTNITNIHTPPIQCIIRIHITRGLCISTITTILLCTNIQPTTTSITPKSNSHRITLPITTINRQHRVQHNLNRIISWIFIGLNWIIRINSQLLHTHIIKNRRIILINITCFNPTSRTIHTRNTNLINKTIKIIRSPKTKIQRNNIHSTTRFSMNTIKLTIQIQIHIRIIISNHCMMPTTITNSTTTLLPTIIHINTNFIIISHSITISITRTTTLNNNTLIITNIKNFYPNLNRKRTSSIKTSTRPTINIIISTIQLITTINQTRNSLITIIPRRRTIITKNSGIKTSTNTRFIKMLHHHITRIPNTNNILLTTNRTITIIHIQNRISR